VPEISKTADQALTVLLAVAERGPLTPAELASTLGMNRTVVHRLLSTLHLRGFVARSADGYVPGAVLVSIADRVQPALRSTGRQVMRAVADKVGETLVLHVPDGEQAVVLEQAVPDRHIVRVEHEIGSRHPLAAGASGRAILAFSDTALIDRVRRRHTASEETLQQVRELGYALSHDELQNGVHGLAVPVLDPSGFAVASMAMLVPVSRAAGLHEHTETMLQASARVARALRTT